MIKLSIEKHDNIKIMDTIQIYVNEHKEEVLKTFGLYYKGSTYNTIGYKADNCIINQNTIKAETDTYIEIYTIEDLKEAVKRMELTLKGFNIKDWE